MRARVEASSPAASTSWIQASIEVRVSGAEDSSVVFAHALLDIDTARRMAMGWRRTLIATGTFSELLH